jgi:hypothetical protein
MDFYVPPQAKTSVDLSIRQPTVLPASDSVALFEKSIGSGAAIC